MKDPIKTLKEFLRSHFKAGQPILLGYSGGPDSKALLYALLECQKEFPLELHLAHIDHNWRPESGMEAEILKSEAESLSLPFHLHTLDHLPTGNLEAHGREARLGFFQKIYEQISAQGLILAHQADDQAETVLKRILEGAHLRYIQGIEEISSIKGMRVWRPLLSLPKKDLEEWLKNKNLSAILDPTNSDLRFLRGRMREEIIPSLSAQFGKEIAHNLCRLGQSAAQVKDYFSRKLASHHETLRRSPWGIHWDLTAVVERVELEYLLKELLPVSHQIFQGVIDSLIQRKANKQFLVKDLEIQVDRGHLFLLHKREVSSLFTR